jgi:hypothetical protein
MLLLAWTAAFAIIALTAIIVGMVGLRVLIVCFASERTRWFWDVLFAVIGLALLMLLF